jgi:hypothetical protein
VPRYMMVDGWSAAPRAGVAIMDLEGQLPQIRAGRPAADASGHHAGSPAADTA